MIENLDLILLRIHDELKILFNKALPKYMKINTIFKFSMLQCYSIIIYNNTRYAITDYCITSELLVPKFNSANYYIFSKQQNIPNTIYV